MENQPIPRLDREKTLKESGYSEVEQAKVIEGSTIDIKQVKKRKAAQLVSQENKIINAYQVVHKQIMNLLENLPEVVTNQRHQERVLEEIKDLHSKQEELIQCLLLSQRGELSELTTSKEVWNLIE